MNIKHLPRHPRTGLRAIGTLKSGRLVWPVMGGDGTDDSGGDSNSDGDADSGSSGGDSDDAGSGDDSSSKDGGDKSGDDGRTYTADEVDKLISRMKAADRRADDYAKQLKELKDKDKPTDQKLREERKELVLKLEEMTNRTNKLRIQVAFLRSNEVQWHDPEDALTFVDLSKIDVDDEGNVDSKALKAALKDLAKRKPHLVKTAKKSDDDDSSSKDDDSKNGGSSGSDMTGKRKGGTKAPSRDDLAKRYPALRRR